MLNRSGMLPCREFRRLLMQAFFQKGLQFVFRNMRDQQGT